LDSTVRLTARTPPNLFGGVPVEMGYVLCFPSAPERQNYVLDSN